MVKGKVSCDYHIAVVSSEEDRESQEVRAKFSLFLKDFINRNALIDGILDHIVVILVRCRAMGRGLGGGVNIFVPFAFVKCSLEPH